mgnify:FL=1|jgi:hypothetical protein
MAVDVSQIVELVENDGYPAMFESYDSQPVIYPLLGEVRSPADAGEPYYGNKETTFQGLERFKLRPDLQDVDDSTFDRGWTYQCGIQQYSRSLTIPARVRLANDSVSRIKASIIQAATDWGEVAQLQKDDVMAGMFQKGTLTAGSTEYFDNAYPGNADSNAGFIYDGLPWFDTAHTLSGSASTYANHTASLGLTAANLQTVLQTMRHTNAVNERGERIMIRPTHMIVPGGLEYTARTILESTQLPGSPNNDANVVQGSLQLVTWNALSDSASSAAWWVVQAGRGLTIYDSGAPTIAVKEKQNGDIVVVAEYHFGAAVSNWRYSYCANKAAS